MIIIMQHGADEPAVDHVIERIGELGLRPHVSRGEFRTIIGAVGDEHNAAHVQQLAALPGVENVMPIMKPYKLASREFHPDGSSFQIGGVTVGGNACVGIAGPCTIENDTTVFTVGRAVKAAGAKLLRGGAFKPRTSPYSFQGLGEEGLRILRAAGDELDMPVVSEVMDPRHVELACDYVDVLQIGARNMQNYRLLEAVGDCDRAVLLKRGPAATIDELLLAAEYVLNGGNQRVMLCERGIRTFEAHTRFTLPLATVTYLHGKTHLPVVVDPSHGTGHTWLVTDMCKASVAIGADGLIVEVHPDPENARSDGAQSMNFEQFDEMMKLCRRVAESVDRQM